METIINEIRGILRSEGITGMDSINHCIIFVVCRLLTEELCIKMGIDVKYSFNNIMKDINGKELGNQDLWSKFYTQGNINCFVGQIANKLGFKNIKFNIKGVLNLKKIVKLLEKLDVEELSNNYDIIGTIYEYHLKSGTSNSMRDLGQYYTHRSVISYMIALCDPSMKDGIIENIVDPTMGTGGFLTMAIKYLNKKYQDIDWNINKDNIIGFDIDGNVRNMAMINIFLEIGELCRETLVEQNTLYNDMKFKNDTILNKAKIILANEPMGLKNIIHASCCERIKELKIRGTKAEPLFLQLVMQSLDDDGRCAIIVPDGILFNESSLHSKTREYLIENFNLLKVISLNDDFFLNTGVKTSILFFKKDGSKTTNIEFMKIHMDKNNIVETSVVKVDYDKIKANNYTLFVNKYTYEIVKKEGVSYKKLDEICKLLPTTKHTSSIGKSSGKYRFYNSSQTDELFVDNCEIIADSIIIGNGGNLSIHYDNNFTPSKHVTVCQNKSNNNLKYVYYYLMLNSHILKGKSAGSTIQWLNKTNISSVEIPIPSIENQQKIVEKLDLLTSCNKHSNKNINDFKKIMKYYIEAHTTTDNDIKLGDLCDLYLGKFNSKDKKEKGLYPFYSSEVNNPSGYIDKYCFDYAEYLILIKDGGAGQGKYGDQIGLGKVFKVTGKSASTSHQYAIVIKDNKNLLTNYLYYYLTIIKNTIMDFAKYTTGLGTIKKADIENLNIPMLSIEKQQQIVTYCDNLTNLIQSLQKQIDSNNELMKQIMDQYIKNEIVNQEQQNIVIEEQPIIVDKKEKRNKPLVKPKAKKVIITNK